MMELLQKLTSGLGITEDQAKGGAGLLFKLAKEKLGSGEFGQISNAIPGLSDLISAAPKPGGLSGPLEGLTSSLGGGQMGTLASLAAGFKSLDMEAGLVGKFIPIVLSFVESKGGSELRGILENILK